MKNKSKAIAVFGLLALVFLPGLRAVAGEQRTSVKGAVRAYAEERMEESGVPGLVFAMVDANGVVTTETFGLADVSNGREMTPETPLRVGSISKPVTAALALELEARGKVDLDEPVDTYLDVDLTDRYGQASTIRQLLQHRGGYPDAFVGSHHLEADDARDLDDWVKSLADRAIAPNVVASYSSVGYTLAGAAIAGAMESDFAEVADRALFEPLGMTGSTFARWVPADVAVGYSWNDGAFTPYPVDTPDLVPGAGLVTTGRDIGRFMSALLSQDSALSEATRQGLLMPAGPYPGLRAYTTGLTEWRYKTRSALYHEGNGIGTTNRMTVLTEERVGFFTSVNGEAMVGMGDPSPQTLFIRDLHEMLVEEFYPGPFSFDAPVAQGNGEVSDVRPGAYVPSRLDTGSVLRLEALVSQFAVDGDEEGMLFLDGPEGLTYATTGGTGSYREAAWWETIGFNLSAIGGSIVLAIAGSIAAARMARGPVRWLTLLTGGLSVVFVGTLGYGMATIEVMDLFTGLPTPIRAAQAAIAGALVSATALATVYVTAARKRDPRTGLTLATSAVVLAAFTLGSWSWVWQVLPI